MLVLGAYVSAGAASPSLPWERIVGVRQETSGDSAVKLWRRPGEIVLMEESENGLYRAQCIEGSFSEYIEELDAVIIRDRARPGECYSWAGGRLTGYGASAYDEVYSSAEIQYRGVRALHLERRTNSATEKPAIVVLDAMSRLPLLVKFDGRAAITWSFQPIQFSTEPPPQQPDAPRFRERYVYFSLAELRAVVSGVPPRIGEMQFREGFALEQNDMTQYFASWEGATGLQVQLASTPVVASEDELGLQAEGGVFRFGIQDGSRHLQLLSSDLQLLRLAVDAIRPGSWNELGSD